VPWNQFFVLQEIDSQIDHLRGELSLASLLGDETNAHLQEEIARARRQEGPTRSQLELRERQRSEVTALLPAYWVKHYERLRQRLKTRPWVVRLEGTSCPACNFLLPLKLAGDAMRNNEPVACPSCRRLLLPEKAEKKQ
jgi:predicted  nucleic acid-binding Zn-ribbon protein